VPSIGGKALRSLGDVEKRTAVEKNGQKSEKIIQEPSKAEKS